MRSFIGRPSSMGATHVRRRREPLRHASDIMAVWIIRDPDTTPSEPLRVSLDRSTLEHLGWKVGDTVTLSSEVDGVAAGAGKLIIRKAKSGEIALILPDLPPNVIETANSVNGTGDRVGLGPCDMIGPHFEWCFPAEWVELFFPGDYDPDGHDFNSQTEWSWSLADILDQSEQLELKLESKGLFLYLQRRDLSPTELSLHLVPGLLHLMHWNTETSLVLESEFGFDPFEEQDTLIIREPTLGEEPNLSFSAGFWHADINPIWLNRYFPDIFYPREDLGPEEYRPYEADQYDDYPDDREYRDTLKIELVEIRRTKHSLTFDILTPRRSP